jgi:hypothetical protein
MADLRNEEQEVVDKLAEPSANEAKILEGNEVRDEALKKVEEAKKEEKEEDKLPELSTAEFRVYNSMADNMEYFVSPQLQLGIPNGRCRANMIYFPSTTISANPGIHSKAHATITAAQTTCLSKPSSLPACP